MTTPPRSSRLAVLRVGLYRDIRGSFGLGHGGRVHGAPAAFAPPHLVPEEVLFAIVALCTVVADGAIVRGVFGDPLAGSAGKRVGFGSGATATKTKPPLAAPHP